MNDAEVSLRWPVRILASSVGILPLVAVIGAGWRLFRDGSYVFGIAAVVGGIAVAREVFRAVLGGRSTIWRLRRSSR
ncbi:MAG: hypothetical protein GTN78_19880 [Gemmatimonadales bacterium]|nr:hypothetical protein [Gemmatimonadales bacterium]NIN12634.1 hypothetical protein [Gemmatimonadales bacterium]NIR02427.1 hypothetical protein [Gemmatimonadales bacterium]NIS66218.1 hypothetical protein [Gemmatimonadales bacterium]